MDEGVVVATVADETEAEVVCGLIRSAGFECGYRLTEALDSPLDGIVADGPREILVHESELAAVRELLDASNAG